MEVISNYRHMDFGEEEKIRVRWVKLMFSKLYIYYNIHFLRLMVHICYHWQPYASFSPAGDVKTLQERSTESKFILQEERGGPAKGE